MQMCQKCGIDYDRCDCDTKTPLELLMSRKMELEQELDKIRREIREELIRLKLKL